MPQIVLVAAVVVPRPVFKSDGKDEYEWDHRVTRVLIAMSMWNGGRSYNFSLCQQDFENKICWSSTAARRGPCGLSLLYSTKKSSFQIQYTETFFILQQPRCRGAGVNDCRFRLSILCSSSPLVSNRIRRCCHNISLLRVSNRIRRCCHNTFLVVITPVSWRIFSRLRRDTSGTPSPPTS